MTTASQMCEMPAISPLMRSAWSTHNAGAREPNRALYQELLERLFGRSNEQNALIEAALQGRR